MTSQDFLFRGPLEELDPAVAEIIRHETARQARTLILIPSESTIPQAVREAIGSAFHNIYAEGYPAEATRLMSEDQILDFAQQLAEFRRNSDARYYKGTEYADIIEALARRRVAEAFAPNGLHPDNLFVNVQPLSGAPANSAVYTALIKPGDTILSMDLIMGGHLSHGSPVARSGKFFNIVSYGIHPETEHLDYDAMMRLALEHKPKIVIGGYSSFPLAPDWQEYRRIADAVGAYLLADVAHMAGLILAGVYPNPVGIADIVTFTTHKTLGGPRGAVIITHRKDLAAKLDRGVFPGEQGGPHMNSIAGLAVAMKLARTEQFQQLQRRTLENARLLATRLQARGLRIPHGGTDSHILLVDCRSIKGPDGTSLSGDMAARILDLTGIVCNRQTIPGDRSALRPSGIRLGTPWITQRGATADHIEALAEIIADVLLSCVPFSLTGKDGARAKIDFDTLQNARLAVRGLVDQLGIDTDARADGYPHFAYIDDVYEAGWHTFDLKGARVREFLQYALTSDVYALKPGQMQATHLLEKDGQVMSSGAVEMVSDQHYRLHLDANHARAAAWLRSLSDGFIIFDDADPYARIPGPVTVTHSGQADGAAIRASIQGQDAYAVKTYHIGFNGALYAAPRPPALPAFVWQEQEGELRKTPLYEVHRELKGKMAPFAGYEMPLWYDKVLVEHLAVRSGAGIFDVSHMGVWDLQGPGAEEFLDGITANDVSRLEPGKSHYTFLLDPDGQPFDDLLVYRLAADHFFIVVNASNNDKDWAWVQGVMRGEVCVDNANPWRRITVREGLRLRDLRAELSGADRRVDLALQGPKSRDILLSLGGSEEDLARVQRLPWAGITRATLGGYDLIISRTGYTGERIAYEVFPHPDQAAELFRKLIELGATPCGLAARDSLRIEAGLPLYGHELAGPLNLNPADAGMGSYVKLHKPFFVGKAAFIAHEAERDAEVARFRMENKAARPAHQGDPIVDARGRVVGIVTSCSMDSEGYQLGQAYLKREFHTPDTLLALYAGSARAKVGELSNLKLGDKALMPETIRILSRFPSKK